MDATIKRPRSCAVQDEFGLGLSFVIERLSGQCIYGNQAAFSWVLGYMSLICWFQAQFPQLIMNLQRSSTDGISAAFLANWMLGDITNLIGCLLTRQLPFQTLLATYYCFIDACLVFQYFLYNFIRRPSVVVLEGVEQTSSTTSPSSRAKGRSSIDSLLVLAALVSNVVAVTGEEPVPQQDLRFVGAMAAWTSSLLYFISRLPQIYKNYQRKSTDGLSVLLFVAAFLGNLFYTLSILVSPYAWASESQSAEDAKAFLLSALPFLIGSAGTLCFDIAIVTQWACYRDAARPFFNVEFSFRRHRRHQPLPEAETLLRQSIQHYGIASPREDR